MAFSSQVTYTGDGVIKQFNIPFPFISNTHVNVFVNQTLQLDPMNYTQSGSTITFGNAPGSDAAVVIKRETSPIDILVDFVDGSVLNENDLDTAYLHNFYLGQEYADSFNKLIQDAFLAIATGVGISEVDPEQVIAALVNEMLDQAAAATLQQRVNDIDTNAEAIIQLGTDLQIEIDNLADGVAAVVYIQAGEPTPGVGGIPDPILDGARWYDSDDNNKSYIYDQDGVVWVDIDDPRIGDAVADISVIQVDVGDNAAAIVSEQTARATGDSAIASDLALLGAANGGDTAFILDLDTVEVVAGVETLASRFSTITSDKDANAASITSEATTRATADAISAALFVLLGAENGAQTAFILDTATVKIDTDQGDTFAERFTALAASDSSNAASIVTIQTVTIPGVESDVGALEARYGVTLNVNGYITGFLQNNDGSSGEFVILADKFAVVDPSGDPGETEFIPFLIEGGVVKMQNLEISGNLIVAGTINGSRMIDGTIGTTQIGPNSITTTQLNAQSVTTDKLDANSVTAGKINVGDLSAINADLGSITAGVITLDSAGHIKSKKTTFLDTQAGFWLGIDSGAAKFHIGNATDFIKFDGTSLIVRGNVSIGDYTASNTLMLSADTLRSDGSDPPLYIEKKRFEINRPGTVRVTFDHRMTNISPDVQQAAKARILLDTVNKAAWSVSTTSWIPRTFDLTVDEESQFITIEIRGGMVDVSEPISASTEIRNVRIKADKSDGESVITD